MILPLQRGGELVLQAWVQVVTQFPLEQVVPLGQAVRLTHWLQEPLPERHSWGRPLEQRFSLRGQVELHRQIAYSGMD
jgi:hypothetical protein